MASRPMVRKVLIALVIAWAALFLAGAAGELLGYEWLRRATDLKRFFLR